MNRHQEERQLLEMQADILRLKIAAAHLRNRRETPAASHFSNLLPTQSSWLPEVLKLANRVPVGRLLMAAVAKPRRWRHKLWGAAAVAALAWLQQKR